MEKRNKEIDGLIEGYLNGALSDEEFSRLSVMLKENSENRAYFNQYKSQWISDSEDAEKSWQRVKSKIIRSGTEGRIKAEKFNSLIN